MMTEGDIGKSVVEWMSCECVMRDFSGAIECCLYTYSRPSASWSAFSRSGSGKTCRLLSHYIK